MPITAIIVLPVSVSPEAAGQLCLKNGVSLLGEAPSLIAVLPP